MCKKYVEFVVMLESAYVVIVLYEILLSKPKKLF